MKALADLISDNEAWLVRRILGYAREHDYTRYTSTLEEAWYLSIRGLSEPLVAALLDGGVPELSSERSYEDDPIASFGIVEAKRHRARGVPFALFLGLMKYYREAYRDLVDEATFFGKEKQVLYRRQVDRFFDHVEIGFCSEWAALTDGRGLGELQDENLRMTNEKNRYLTIFESIPTPVLLLDADDRIHTMNRAASDILEHAGKPGAVYYGKQSSWVSLHWLAGELDTLRRTGAQELTCEKQVLVPAGLGRYEVKLKRMVDVSGKFNGTVVAMNDVTQRRWTEDALKASEGRYRSLVESSPDAIVVIDEQRRVSSWNQAFLDLFGYQGSEVERRPMRMLHPSDESYALFLRALRSAMDRDGVFRVEWELSCKDGTVVPAEVVVSRVRVQHGGTTGYMGIIRDISQRKHAEKALREEEERYRILFNSANDAIFVFGIDDYGRPSPFVEVNEVACQRLGYSRQELLRLSLADINGPEQGHVIPELLVRLARDRHVRFETIHVARGGAAIPVEISAHLFDLHGQPTVLSVARDITEWKAAERALRTAKEAAEAGSRAKGEFLANISHEIRTPMNAIVGMTQIVLDSPLLSEQRESLEMVQQSAHSLLGLLNSVLDFSKIEARKIDLQQIAFDLSDPLEHVVRSFKPQAEKKYLTLASVIEDGVPDRVVGDPFRLQQILTNLIGNAVKFTDRGEVVVRIGLEPPPLMGIEPTMAAGESAGVALRFSVSDTGPGIPVDKRQAIFDTFVQADGSLARRHGGAGLGLAIAKELVGLMGGRIWVESELGQGSTFYFTANLGIAPEERVTAEEEAGHRDARGRLGEPVAAQPGGDSQEGEAALAAEESALTILVAEDHPANQLVARRFLEKLGHRVVAVSNGLDALRALSQERFDMVFMDIQMPEMDGLEATRCIRSGSMEGVDPRVPIVALTAHAIKGDRERFIHAGMDDYISKPLNLRELRRVIQKIASAGARFMEDREGGGLRLERQGPVDGGHLEELFGDDPDALRDFLESYVVSTRSTLEPIGELFNARQNAGIRFRVHAVKGASLNVGAHEVALRAEDMERALERQEWERAREAHARMLSAFAEVEEYVRIATGIELASTGQS